MNPTPTIQRPPHLALIDNAFVRAATQPGRQVIIAVPPRHGKSQTCSLYGPAWYLNAFPDRRVILCSYGAQFAETWGQQARDTLNQAHANGIAANRVRRDVSSAGQWKIEGHSGGMLTSGVGGGITGWGANLLICDDLIKNDDEAARFSVREKTWKWLNATARTRLEPGGSIFVIATRWHEDDPTGRLLEQEAGEWDVISFPAIAEENDALGRVPGQALWPERYDEDALAKIKRTQGSYNWASLYQQRPAPLEGGMFKRNWFTLVAEVPAKAERVRYWDLAATADGGDYTVGLRLARADGVYYIEDVKRDQLSPHGARQLRDQTAQLDGRGVRIMLPQDPGQAGKEQAIHMIHELDGFDVHTARETGAKEFRAKPVAAQAEAGNIKIVRGLQAEMPAWIPDFLDEICAFPNGAHDDQVDALSGAHRELCKRPAAKFYT